MPRNTDLSTILFPVELRPVGYTETDAKVNDTKARSGLTAGKNDFNAIGQYKAVVDVTTGTVFAVVSSRYELLHNSRALDLGKKAFEHLFPATSADDFIVFDIQTTKTRSACHIDLIHKTYSTDVWEQETWLPFLRVSNSYNRYRALSFDFGFVRKLCSNGVIFRKESIKAKFYHTKGRLEVDLKQDQSFKQLKELEREFSAHMKGLRAISVDEQYLLPLSIFLLGLEFKLDGTDEKRREKEVQRLAGVVGSLRSLIKKYLKELGGTAYTAMNVVTDLATHTPNIVGNFATSASLQEEVGTRSRDLIHRLHQVDGNRLESILEDQIQLVG